MIAATSWPDAAVAIAGVLLALSIIVALIWAVASTLRARMSISARRPTAGSPRSPRTRCRGPRANWSEPLRSWAS